MNSSTVSTAVRQLGVLLFACCALAQASRPQHAHLSLISAQTSTVASASQWIGLHFQLDPGWHIYWTNPGDSGEPPKVIWHLPGGVQAGDLQFPPPHRIQDHGLTDYGYESDVVLLSKLTGTASKPSEIAADVRYLVCREVCIPGKDHVSLNLAGQSATSADAELIRSTQARLPLALPAGAQVSAALEPDALVIKVAGKGASLGEITDFIPADAQVIENSAKPAIQGSAGMWRIRVKKSEQLDHPVARLRGLLVSRDKSYNIDVPVARAQKSSQKGSAPKHS